MTSFDALLRELAGHQVAFILVGGAAAIAHGSSRLTQDLDLVYERTPENIDRLVKALAAFGPYPQARPELHPDHNPGRHRSPR